MASFLFLILFSSTLLSIEAFEDACPSIQCGHDTPNIQFPFQVKGLQNCGHPGFELVCKDNTTFIPFPSYGELVVKSISYNTKKLNLLDPKNCVHGVFLNLNLSLTPFHYYYVVKNYTYLNCSSRLPPNSFNEVPCLSGSKYHVYTVEPSLAIPNSCRPVKTVAIPFQYSPYLSDNSFGLGLSWDMPDCEAKGGHCGLNFKDKTECFNLSYDIVLSIGIFIFAMAVATVIIIRIYNSKKIHCQDEEKYRTDVEKLGDFKGLRLKPDFDTKQSSQ
ncbi:RING-H2 finger protein ATL22-like [Fagus crenata]